MKPRPRRGINFGPCVEWRAVSVVSDEQTADNPEVSSDVRLLALARARMDFSGHAHFKRGEVRERLAYVQKTGKRAGEIRVPSREAVRKAINRLVGWGGSSVGVPGLNASSTHRSPCRTA